MPMPTPFRTIKRGLLRWALAERKRRRELERKLILSEIRASDHYQDVLYMARLANQRTAMVSGAADELSRLKAENEALKADNARLMKELDRRSIPDGL